MTNGPVFQFNQPNHKVKMVFKKGIILIVAGVLLLLPVNGKSQLVNLTQIPAYQQIFVTTDAFDSSYLTQLEKYYNQNLPDTIKLAIGNDLAYYWHTRNLAKAYVLASEVLSFAKTTNNKVWEGRIQTTLGAILLRQEKLDSAFTLLESAKKKLQKKDWPRLLTQMVYVMERRDQLSKAANYAMDGLRLGESLNDLRATAMAYSDLSNLFSK